MVGRADRAGISKSASRGVCVSLDEGAGGGAVRADVSLERQANSSSRLCLHTGDDPGNFGATGNVDRRNSLRNGKISQDSARHQRSDVAGSGPKEEWKNYDDRIISGTAHPLGSLENGPLDRKTVDNTLAALKVAPNHDLGVSDGVTRKGALTPFN